MKVAVTTPTGHVGSALTRKLLDEGADVTLLVRDPAKVRSFTDRGARAEAGDLQDVEFVRRATRGADVLFWVTPSNFTSPDFRAFQNALGRNAAAAVKENDIARVVLLSSVGAQHDAGTGPILGLHDTECLLAETGAHLTNLRPNMFMENHLAALPTVLETGCVFLPVDGSRRTRFIATRDVATMAAVRILDPGWTGRHDLELHGPEELSFDEVAARIGEALDREVRHVPVTPGQMRQALTEMGSSPDVASRLVEMYEGVEKGLLRPEQRAESRNTGTTTFAVFAREVMAPAAAAAAAH